MVMLVSFMMPNMLQPPAFAAFWALRDLRVKSIRHSAAVLERAMVYRNVTLLAIGHHLRAEHRLSTPKANRIARELQLCQRSVDTHDRIHEHGRGCRTDSIVAQVKGRQRCVRADRVTKRQQA